jgi:citrate synthase
MENVPDQTATLMFDGRQYSAPLLRDSEGRLFLDIRKIYREAGLRTYDPGYANTAVCSSSISLVNGEEGRLSYRGYAVEDLAENCSFIEVAYLLLHGYLPDSEKKYNFSTLLNRHSMIHEDMRTYFRQYPEHAHPMAVLSAMVVSLSSFYPELNVAQEEELDITATRVLSKLRTIAAFSYKKSIGEPYIYPRKDLDYCSNFLNMMFSSPVGDYEIDPVVVKAMNQLLILHADHGQNCSTATVRLTGSAGSNLYASITAGICALWGSLHGGANQRVVEMLETIHREGETVDRVLERAQDRNDPFRLMGFGHRVYKTYDPRARIARQVCRNLLEQLDTSDPLLDIAMHLEEKALAHPYFQERFLYPNVDFYTGISYRVMGFPFNMYTVLFALGRLPGWISQWQELNGDDETKIGRPSQRYIGDLNRAFIPIEERSG